jgi:hypothetical protein
MFAEMKKIIFKEYPELAAASNIYLIDGGPACVPMSKSLSRRYLQGIDRARSSSQAQYSGSRL